MVSDLGYSSQPDIYQKSLRINSDSCPEIANVIKSDFYMEDLITGGETAKQVTAYLASLWKFGPNVDLILESGIATEERLFKS